MQQARFVAEEDPRLPSIARRKAMPVAARRDPMIAGVSFGVLLAREMARNYSSSQFDFSGS